MVADGQAPGRGHDTEITLFDVVRVRLEHGIERGEVQADVEPERLIEIIGGATMLRMLLHPESALDEQWVGETAAIVTHGVIS